MDNDAVSLRPLEQDIVEIEAPHADAECRSPGDCGKRNFDFFSETGREPERADLFVRRCEDLSGDSQILDNSPVHRVQKVATELLARKVTFIDHCNGVTPASEEDGRR